MLSNRPNSAEPAKADQPSSRARAVDTAGQKDPTRRHCWECLRRCLVCDSTKPACKRCTAAGAVCPGYGNVKPTRLRWLAPGRVTSRPNKLWARAKPPSDEKRQAENGTPLPQSSALPPSIPETTGLPIPLWELSLSIDAHALAQAADYFNSRIYPDLVPMLEMGNNPGVYQISPSLVRAGASYPEYLQLGMICMALNHRMNQMGSHVQRNQGALAERFYQFRGNALRSLRVHLYSTRHCTSDFAIAGIITLLLIDLQYGASLGWRAHLEGATRLIQLRGGFSTVAGIESLDPYLLCLSFVGVIGNTTCPVSDLTMTDAHLEALDIMQHRYGAAIFCFHACPPPLFAEITRINHLRNQLGNNGPTAPDLIASFAHEACEILSRIHKYSAAHWAASKPSSRDDWRLIGEIYQTAVALYCVSSLQSLSLFPVTQAVRSQCAAHGQQLQMLLKRAVASPKLNRFTLWPLVVLGVEAAHDGGAAAREFVADRLPALARDIGTSAPLTAKKVLRTFWSSGETRWDACFDRPYAFLTQIAVDTSRLCQ